MCLAPEAEGEFGLKERGCAERAGGLKTDGEVRQSELGLLTRQQRGIEGSGGRRHDSGGALEMDNASSRIVRRH